MVFLMFVSHSLDVCFRDFWPIGYKHGSLSIQLPKDAMRKSCSPTEFQPASHRLPPVQWLDRLSLQKRVFFSLIYRSLDQYPLA